MGRRTSCVVFASRGEDWRLYTAYQHQNYPTPHSSQAQHTTNIVLMWKGTITTRDNALQLLLLVDYMCDWARDIYRPAILMELRILANADTDIATVITDTDIFSSRERLVPQIRLGIEEADPGSRSDENEIFSSFQQLDNEYGAVRHASIIQSRFLCVFITADNIQTFLLSMNEKIRRIFTRKILSLFNSSTKASNHLLTGDALNRIENIWSGHSRLGMPFNVNQVKFHTILQLNYYMSARWEQGRDLCVICVSEDAFDAVIFGPRLKAGWGNAKQPSHSACNQDDVVDSIRQIWNSSARENLLAVISRRSCYVSTDDSYRRSQCNPLTDCEPTIWELANYTYKLHKTGDLEPDEPFLRISKQRNNQRTDSADQGFLNSEDTLKVSPQTGVLIHGLGHHLYGSRFATTLCLYLFRSSTEPPSGMDIGNIIKETFENFDVYHTTRDNGNLNFRDRKHVKQIWNLEEVYGMHFSYGENSFSKWVRFLQCPLPTRQGSSRGPDDSGRYLFTRIYTPWLDPRIIYGGDQAEMRRKYMMKVVAGEARAWSQIAIRRQNEGIDCCSICTGPKEPTSDISDDSDCIKYPVDPEDEDEDEDTDIGYESSGFEGEDDYINYSRYFRRDECLSCQIDTDIRTEYGHPKWFKILVLSGNTIGFTTRSRSGSIPIDPQTDGYDIRTPPPPPLFGAYHRRLIEGTNESDRFIIPDAEAILEGSLDVTSSEDEWDTLSSPNQNESSSREQLSSQHTRKRRRLD